MKNYKFTTKERAERVAKTLGCVGSHTHGEGKHMKYMPCSSMKIFKDKTKKQPKQKEEEVTELIDTDGNWSASNVPILDPASTMQGSTYTDKIVPMSRNPRDPLLRGWYGYYGEGHIKEEDMSGAFGYDDTKDLNYKDTVEFYQDELDLDKDDAIERAKQQGKGERLSKKAPKEIKNKKNFIDRLVLKELGDEDVNEDTIFKKDDSDKDLIKKQIDIKKTDIHPLLVRNIRALRRMAKEYGVSVEDLIKVLKDE